MLNPGPGRPPSPAQRALLRAGFLTTVVGVACGASGTAAVAADDGATVAADGFSQGLTAPAAETVHGIGSGVGNSLGALREEPINPMANTGANPLDNAVGTQIADFRELSTAAVTGPLARGASMSELPVVGPATEPLSG